MKEIYELTAFEMYLGYRRYEKLRTFNVPEFQEIYRRNIKENYRFDDLVDAWPDYPEKKK